MQCFPLEAAVQMLRSRMPRIDNSSKLEAKKEINGPQIPRRKSPTDYYSQFKDAKFS